VLIASYTGGLYSDLNATLRGFVSDRDCLETGKFLKEVLLSLPGKADTVYRGMGTLPALKNLKVNECFSDKAFVSTSLKLEVAEDFADRALAMAMLKEGSGVSSESVAVLVIRSKSGRDVSEISAVNGESEILILPNVFLKLKKKTVTPKYIRFDFEEVESELCD
jgi:hypothetical protein